jgi:hypothetical protein
VVDAVVGGAHDETAERAEAPTQVRVGKRD